MDKDKNRYEIWDSNYDDYFGESYSTYEEAESRIEELDTEFGMDNGLYIIDNESK